jgi:hypothetical protein
LESKKLVSSTPVVRCWNEVGHQRLLSKPRFGEIAMKKFIICTAVLGLAFSSAAQAKGCIKGAIVGGVAGSVAGHGKVGAAAGCVIGHHEANKADAENAKAQAPISPSRGDGKN